MEIILDPSKRACVQECARKYYYSFVRGITPVREPDYFVSGRAWDNALGEWYNKDKGEELKDVYAKAVTAMYKAYQNVNCSPRPQRTPENIMTLFEKYIDYYREEPFEVIRSNVGLKLPYKWFYLAGEIDQYVQWNKLGVVVKENKTTTIIPNSRGWDNYKAGFYLGQYADQITHYLWAVMQISEDVWGACVDVACLDIPKRESTERQLFDRFLLQRTDTQIMDYLEACEFAAAKIATCTKEGIWPREGKHCAGGWGFSPCEYRHLCHANVPLEMIEVPSNIYKEGTIWAPWDGIKRGGKPITETRKEILFRKFLPPRKDILWRKF